MTLKCSNVMCSGYPLCFAMIKWSKQTRIQPPVQWWNHADLYSPLYCLSKIGADTLRLRFPYGFSSIPALCCSSEDAVGALEGCWSQSPRSSRFSASSFLISSRISMMTCARLRLLSMVPLLRVQYQGFPNTGGESCRRSSLCCWGFNMLLLVVSPCCVLVSALCPAQSQSRSCSEEIMSPFTTQTAEKAPVISHCTQRMFYSAAPASSFRKTKQGSEMKCAVHKSFNGRRTQTVRGREILQNPICIVCFI